MPILMAEDRQAGFTTLSDLEEAASKKAEKMAWAYIQGAAGEEWTLRANREAFHRRTLRPRVLVDVEELELGATILGTRVSAPFYVSPTASHGLVDPQAEAATARAASKANILAGFGTLASISLEAIAKAAPSGPRWFQLYLQPEFSVTKSLIERAEKTNYKAIVLTVDMPVAGTRDRETRAGSPLESSIVLGNGPDVVRPPRHPNIDGEHAHIRKEASNTWEVLDRLRETTRLPLVLKGILTREDARRAVEHGAKGVVVSNHGGRQLDGAPASLDALPEVVEEVGSEVEVYFDGGVRRGSDIAMALALGARAVGLGRVVLWALAAGGEAGVSKLLSLMKTDLATVMALTGRRTISEIDRSLVGGSR
ncbi:MAG TPA: alpha-hydroxy acid oxidase [Candidatus Dormibacteraeota bacterium]|nr:alpha-hydroxy acid oxidase [Candidatus Dormibacteraeota bacterium]